MIYLSHIIKVLTVEQVANRWQCCRLTVISKMKKGELKYFKVGREYRTREDWIEEYETGLINGCDFPISNSIKNYTV